MNQPSTTRVERIQSPDAGIALSVTVDQRDDRLRWGLLEEVSELLKPVVLLMSGHPRQPSRRVAVHDPPIWSLDRVPDPVSHNVGYCPDAATGDEIVVRLAGPDSRGAGDSFTAVLGEVERSGFVLSLFPRPILFLSLLVVERREVDVAPPASIPSLWAVVTAPVDARVRRFAWSWWKPVAVAAETQVSLGHPPGVPSAYVVVLARSVPAAVAPWAVRGSVDEIEAFLTGPPLEAAVKAAKLVGGSGSILDPRAESEHRESFVGGTSRYPQHRPDMFDAGFSVNGVPRTGRNGVSQLCCPFHPVTSRRHAAREPTGVLAFKRRPLRVFRASGNRADLCQPGLPAHAAGAAKPAPCHPPRRDRDQCGERRVPFRFVQLMRRESRGRPNTDLTDHSRVRHMPVQPLPSRRPLRSSGQGRRRTGMCSILPRRGAAIDLGKGGAFVPLVLRSLETRRHLGEDWVSGRVNWGVFDPKHARSLDPRPVCDAKRPARGNQRCKATSERQPASGS